MKTGTKIIFKRLGSVKIFKGVIIDQDCELYLVKTRAKFAKNLFKHQVENGEFEIEILEEAD